MINLELSSYNTSLSSVSFKVIDPSNPITNLSLTKEDVILTLNKNSFVDFTLKSDTSNASIYSIIPNNNFLVSDNLYIQVKNPTFISNKIKIIFAQTIVVNKKMEIPFEFSKNDPNQNQFIFSLTSINGHPFHLYTKPVTICNPIDLLKSEIIPQYDTYNSGDIINATVRLFDIYGKPVPDGVYVIELDYSDAV